MQEELANLFTQNMHLSRTASIPQIILPQASPIRYSASQHYHHSAHVASPGAEAESALDRSFLDIRAAIGQHGVDTAGLSAAQARLFAAAGPEPQRRLVEMWRLAPPERGARPAADGEQPRETTLEEEARAAELRYRRRTARDAGPTGIVEILASPGGMEVDARRPVDAPAAEPYMRSGYEVLAERDGNRGAAAAAVAAPPPGKASFNPLGTAVGCYPPPETAFPEREWWHHALDSPIGMRFGTPDRPVEEDHEMS